MDRWIIFIEDAGAYDFDGETIPNYMGELENWGWEPACPDECSSKHDGLYQYRLDSGVDQWKLVEASGMIAHMIRFTTQSGFASRRAFEKLYERPPVHAQPPFIDMQDASEPDLREKPAGPLPVSVVVDFGDVDNDWLDRLAEEEQLDPISSRRIEFDSKHAACLSGKFMLFAGPYIADVQTRIVTAIARRLMFARIAETVWNRSVELSGDEHRLDESLGLASNLRLSYATLICHRHWKPELDSMLDSLYATSRDYKLACEAVDAVRDRFMAKTAGAQRRLAVSLGILTVLVSIATIMQTILTGSGWLSWIMLLVLLIAVIATFVLSRRAHGAA